MVEIATTATAIATVTVPTARVTSSLVVTVADSGTDPWSSVDVDGADR